METISIDPFGVRVRLSQDELTIINFALNEICNGGLLGADELRTRTAYERAQIVPVLEEVHAVGAELVERFGRR